MRMSYTELKKTYEVYGLLLKQERLALAALNGDARYDCIYLHIKAMLNYVGYCLKTLSYRSERPWLVQTRYF